MQTPAATPARTKSLQEEDIFDALGASGIPEEEKGELLMKILTLINQRVFMRVIDTLDQAKQEEFGTALENDDPNAVDSFLTTNIAGYPKMYEEEALKVRHQLIASLA